MSEATGLPEGYKPGLEGVIAGVSAIAEVDAERDHLSYRGYAAHELAENATYEEVAHLLLLGKLPTAAELAAFDKRLKSERTLPAKVISLIKELPKDIHPMIGFRAGIGFLQMTEAGSSDNSAESNLAKAIRLVSASPTLLATLHRVHQGLEPIAPNPELSHPANFLYMLDGKKPDPETARTFGSTMILYAEHGYNASTFAALVTASTLSDMHSAVISGVGALKGPLHGGANEGAIQMLLAIGSAEKAEEWVKNALQRKEKIMGFGHRVYRTRDSRAPLMKKLAEATAKRVGDKTLYPLSCKVEEVMMREKKIFPNVDYHSSVFYHLIGLPIHVYTPIFAIARMVGWTAHVMEQHASNRLIRPECHYQGPRGVAFVPIEKRK